MLYPENVALFVTSDVVESLNVAVTVGFTNVSSTVYEVFALDTAIEDKVFAAALTVIAWVVDLPP